MIKKKLFSLLLPLTTLSIPLSLIACSNKNDGTEYPTYFKDTPKTTINKIKNIFLEHFKNTKFNVEFLDKTKTKEKNWDFNVNDLEKYAFTSEKYRFELDGVTFKRSVIQDQRTVPYNPNVTILDSSKDLSQNTKFKDERVYTFKVYKILSNGQKKLYLDLIKEENLLTLSEPIDITLPTLDDLNTTPNASTYKPIYADWTKTGFVEGTITGWADGDTPYLNVDKVSKTYFENKAKWIEAIKKGGGKVNTKIRCFGIDTPEKNVGGSDAPMFENSLAKKSTSFSQTLIPNGTRVRVITQGKESYNRLVGTIFYGDKFQYSHSAEIVRNGYTLPSDQDSNFVPHTETYYTFLAIANALKEAKENKNGFFKVFPSERSISSYIYLTRPIVNAWKSFVEPGPGDNWENRIQEYKNKLYPNENENKDELSPKWNSNEIYENL